MKTIELKPMPVKGTEFENVRFQFVMMSPALAKALLEGNEKNRKVKTDTVDAYARDVRNGEWVLNHQGIAFFKDGTLMDGQHRLMAVVEAGVAVAMVVSTGWPKKLDTQQSALMDAVDRGTVRSLRDQLELQHGIVNAKDVVHLGGAIAALCCGMDRVKKSSTATVLAIARLYAAEFQWMEANICRDHGLRVTPVGAVVMLGLGVWPEKTREFYEQLKSGLGLTATSPVHHLRRFLLGLRGGHSYDEKRMATLATAHHLSLFVEGKACNAVVTQSPAALEELIRRQGERAVKVAALFGMKPPAASKGEAKPAGKAAPVDPCSAAGAKVGETLGVRFTVTDLGVRLPEGADVGVWLRTWRDAKWIESAGVKEWAKTEAFGKVG